MTSASQAQERWPSSEDPQQEAAAVRLRRVGKEGNGAQIRGSFPSEEGQGVQKVANPSQKTQAVRRYREINGKLHKLCNGPLHRQGRYVPITDFYRRRRNGVLRPRPQCKDCEAHWQGSPRLVPYSRVKFAVTELVSRVGKAEAARLIGITNQQMWLMVTGQKKSLQHKTVAKILLALKYARDNNLVRHRDSIIHGATQRGREERAIQTAKDYYQPETEEQRKERLAVEAERSRQRRVSAKTPPV
jgi:hypothetical protein